MGEMGVDTLLRTANRRTLASTFLIVNGLAIVGVLIALAFGYKHIWLAGLSAVGFLIQSLYVKSSVLWLPESEIALISVFGAPIYSVSKTGRYLAPALISNVWLFPRNAITATVVCPNVLCGPDNRAHTTEGVSDQGDVASLVPDTYVQVSVAVEFTFQIVPALLTEFVGTFGSVSHAQRSLERTVYCCIAAEFGRRGIRDSMRNATELCAAVAEKCHSGGFGYLQAGGVNLMEVRIVKIDFGEELTRAMESVDEAEYNAAAGTRRSQLP